ncbi:hypothetical protein DFH09DRAFT_1000133 [Mycena vulgaris]|nr:hypothetical protein DFH09DRAFT_1000133 [Mycena vulgaris]
MSDTEGTTNPTPRAFAPRAPFDEPSADVILTSSDGIDFHVQRVVLSLASPVFKDMFRLPQPVDNPEIPRILMAESAVVLDRMLRFFYPGAEPVVSSIGDLREILDIAVLKYDIQYIVPVAKKYLQLYIDTHPIPAFALACRHEWKGLAIDAARSSLKFPVRSFGSDSPPELQYITGNNYHALLQYHAACSTASVATTSSLRWIPTPDQHVWSTCRSCLRCTETCILSDGNSSYVREWFLNYMKAAKKALKAEPLARVDDPKLMNGAVKAMKCDNCRSVGFDQLHRFAADILGPKILAEIDQVILNLNF